MTACERPVEPRRPLRKLLDVAREEVSALHPWLRFVELLVLPLPHLALCRLRTALYRLAGVSIGRGSLVFGRICLTGHGPILRRLRIGEKCNINAPAFFDLTAEITLGDHVSLGHHAVLVTTDHDTRLPAHRGGAIAPRPIVIEDGCLIGASVTIMPGVRIGRSSVVAPGSLVAADVPPDKLVGGVPARVVKSLGPSP